MSNIFNDKEIKAVLLDVIQFHKANCKDSHCELLLNPQIWVEIFSKLDITLTEAEQNLFKGE